MGLAATSRADGQEANVHSPVFMAPGFQFEQVDTLCILPIAGSANDEQQRLALMWKLQDNGYCIADPNCYRESSTSNGMPGKKPHWMLKISTDELEAKPVGQPPKGTEFIAYQMIAVLLDNNSGKEVWRDTEVTKYLPTKTDRVGEIIRYVHQGRPYHVERPPP